MSRRFATSAALVAALLAVAAAQPPGKKKPIDPAADKADPQPPKEKKADATEAAVAAALRNDTDVRIAQAKVQLAEAELAKAKQAVVLKVMTLKATIEDHRRAEQAAEERLAWAEQMVRKGVAEQRILLEERAKLETAKAALARAETELKLLTGDAGGVGAAVWEVDPALAGQDHVRLGLRWLAAQQAFDRTAEHNYARNVLLAQQALLDAVAVKGPIPDRIRAALDKPVKIAAKGEKVTFEKALEVFRRDAGFDVAVRGTYPVRYTADPNNPSKPQSHPIEITSEGEELPVGAWFQLFEDNAVFAQRGGPGTRFRFYVRDYGLLISTADSAPPDAPSLTEFWKQKPPAAAKKDTAPEPKSK